MQPLTISSDYHKLTYYYYAETYVNFNELVTDLFKQYKVRIWMSAINPASCVNPAGNMQVQPPSAVGPGAIMHSNANASLAVGPGFGHNNHHRAGQYGKFLLSLPTRWTCSLPFLGRGQHAPQANFDEGYNAFSYQLPNYNAQANFNMSPWAAQGSRYNQQAAYNSFPMQGAGYPNATASGSPMNYGAYYPPATPAYGTATTGTGYRGGQTGAQSYTPTVGPAYGQYNSAQYYKGSNASGATNGPGANATGGYGNGHTPTSAASYNPGYDPSLVSSMQNMSFGK
jgi:hypothetical protein